MPAAPRHDRLRRRGARFSGSSGYQRDQDARDLRVCRASNVKDRLIAVVVRMLVTISPGHVEVTVL